MASSDDERNRIIIGRHDDGNRRECDDHDAVCDDCDCEEDDDDDEEEEEGGDRILSIQSHVVSGYVGNKAAVFPLQLLGHDVDVINSVHFSNHTGYGGGFEGDVMDGDRLLSVLRGLERNALLSGVRHVLTGYIGSESFLRAVLRVVSTARRESAAAKTTATATDDPSHRSFRYVCDPVLGDGGEFYVPKELVRVYRERVLPVADVITPNQFEAEQLVRRDRGETSSSSTTTTKVDTIESAVRACRALHDMGPPLVFITSMVLRRERDAQGQREGEEVGRGRTLTMVASHRKRRREGTGPPPDKQQQPEEQKVWRIDCPEIPGRFTGTGDLCAALLLAHTAASNNGNNKKNASPDRNQPSKNGGDDDDNDGVGNNDYPYDDDTIPNAMEKVVNTMYAVIERTYRRHRRREETEKKSATTTTTKNTKGNDDQDDDDNENAGAAATGGRNSNTNTPKSSSSSCSARSRELRLIQSKDDIENPKLRFRAVRVMPSRRDK